MEADNTNIKVHTFFGLRVYDHYYVKESEIMSLPFYEFWLASAECGGMYWKDETRVVELILWEAFSEYFIKTGKHRYIGTAE